jgi:hypothetical protein
MKNLSAYVQQKNAWNSIFGQKPLTLKESDAQKIADMIDCDLSPENISCDGELSISKIRARRAQMERVAIEFQKMFPNIKLYEF